MWRTKRGACSRPQRRETADSIICFAVRPFHRQRTVIAYLGASPTGRMGLCSAASRRVVWSGRVFLHHAASKTSRVTRRREPQFCGDLSSAQGALSLDALAQAATRWPIASGGTLCISTRWVDFGTQYKVVWVLTDAIDGISGFSSLCSAGGAGAPHPPRATGVAMQCSVLQRAKVQRCEGAEARRCPTRGAFEGVSHPCLGRGGGVRCGGGAAGRAPARASPVPRRRRVAVAAPVAHRPTAWARRRRGRRRRRPPPPPPPPPRAGCRFHRQRPPPSRRRAWRTLALPPPRRLRQPRS